MDRAILPAALLAAVVATAGGVMLTGNEDNGHQGHVLATGPAWDMPVIAVGSPSVSPSAEASATASAPSTVDGPKPGTAPTTAAPAPPRQTATMTLDTKFLRSILSDGTNVGHPAEAGYVDTSNPDRRRVHRTLFKFDVNAFLGKEIASAKVIAPGSWGWGCTASQAVKLQRITAAWNHDQSNWFNQPPTTSVNEATAKDPQGCSGDKPSYEGGWSWTITRIAQDWASGAASNHGLLMRIVDDLARPNPWDTQYHRCFTALQLVVTYYK